MAIEWGFTVIDAHLHLWNPLVLEYFWLEPLSPLYRAFGPETFELERRAAGVRQAVFVQASHDPRENRMALEWAKQFPWIAGVVGWVDLEADDLNAQLELLTKEPRFKGVRHLVHTEADPRWLLRASVGRGLETLAEHGLSFDLVLRPEQFATVSDVVAAHPNLTFVLDHLGYSTTDQTFSTWARTLDRLAMRRNVTAKISELPQLAAAQAIWVALQCFGPNRLMLGGGYPICTQTASYRATLETLFEALRHLEANALNRITTENASRIYRLEPLS